MNLPVRMLFRTRLHSDCCVLSFSLALAAYAATASLIGSSSRKPLPNIREQQISCLGDATSSRSRHGVPRSSRAVFSMTTLNFFWAIRISVWKPALSINSKNRIIVCYPVGVFLLVSEYDASRPFSRPYCQT